jgi:hypothetical protein
MVLSHDPRHLCLRDLQRPSHPMQRTRRTISGLVCSASVSSQVSCPFNACLRICRRAPVWLGRGLSLAPGVQVPDVIQKALEAAPPTRKSTSNRESLQRKRYWWLPYVVLEFDKNEVLIDAMGGDLSNPVWNYRADL